MGIFSKLFKSRKQGAAATPSRSSQTQKQGVVAPLSWSSKMRASLDEARQLNRQSVPNLVDLLFKTPIPINSPSMSDDEVSALLNYPGMSPEIEVKSVEAATEYQQWIRECNALVSNIKEALNAFPGCALRGDLLDLAIAAAGYDLNIRKATDYHDHLPGKIAHIHVSPDTKNSMAAVEQLCAAANPLTTNLLHKIASKKDIMIKRGACTHFRLETLSFTDECEAAAKELAARGNPPYDPDAYFT